MKLAGLLLLVLLLPASRCADVVTGVHEVKHPDGTTTIERNPGAAPLDLLSWFVPWGAAASSMAGNLWLAIRRRQAGEAAVAVVEGVHAIKDSLTVEQKQKMTQAQERLGSEVRQRVRSIAHAVERRSL